MTRQTLWRLLAVDLLLLAAFVALHSRGATATQDATPSSYSCETASTPTPGMDHGGTDMGTPQPAVEFDQLYIDMMIPHHASIVALAQAALPRLQDERLRTIAQTVIGAQTAEISELRGYRELWYGSAEPQPADEQAMMQVMPGMSMPMDAKMAQMDAATQVALLCAADDADRAFIDLVIPHHQSAVMASETAVQQATRDEILEFAERVIVDQQREIGELRSIRQQLYGSATPEPVG